MQIMNVEGAERVWVWNVRRKESKGSRRRKELVGQC